MVDVARAFPGLFLSNDIDSHVSSSFARLADHAGRGDDRAAGRAHRRLGRTVGRARTTARSTALLAVGTTFLGLVLVGVVLYLLISIKEINLNQRQSNFIDSVTHELKCPSPR